MNDTLHILLIEDDQDDVDLFRYALKLNGTASRLDVLMAGDEVSPYLLTVPVLPDVIVLDLNLPKVHGLDVLRQIKANADFKSISMVVLTTSSAPEDRELCVALGADQFMIKPVTVAAFADASATIVNLALLSRQS